MSGFAMGDNSKLLMRSSSVLHLWRQAQTTGAVALEPLVGNGWLKNNNGKLVIDGQ